MSFADILKGAAIRYEECTKQVEELQRQISTVQAENELLQISRKELRQGIERVKPLKKMYDGAKAQLGQLDHECTQQQRVIAALSSPMASSSTRFPPDFPGAFDEDPRLTWKELVAELDEDLD